MPGKPPIYPAGQPQGLHTTGTGGGSLWHATPPCPPHSDNGTQLSLCLSFPGQWLRGAGREAAQCWRCLWVPRDKRPVMPAGGQARELCRWRGVWERVGDSRAGQDTHLGQAGSEEHALKELAHALQELVHVRPLEHIHLRARTDGQRAARCWHRPRLTRRPHVLPRGHP